MKFRFPLTLLLLFSACMNANPVEPTSSTVPVLNDSIHFELPDGWTLIKKKEESDANTLTLQESTDNYQIEVDLKIAPSTGGLPIPTDPEGYSLVTKTAQVTQHACAEENPPSDATACYVLHLASDDESTFYAVHFSNLKTTSPVWDSSIPEPWTPPIEILTSDFESLLSTAHKGS